MKKEDSSFPHHNHLLVLYGSIISAGALFFVFSSPVRGPSLMPLIGFVILGAIIYSLIQLLFIFFLPVSGQLRTRQRLIAVTITLIPLILLILQSIGQLTIRDCLVLAGLIVIGGFYASRRH